MKLTLGEFIPQVLASTPDAHAPNLTNLPNAVHLPELLPEISPLPDVLQPHWAERTFLHPRIRREMQRGSMLELYIGGPGGNFPVLHWDGLSTHAFLMQIAGVKQYWVWPPDDSPHLYPGEAPNISPIRDIEHPDLALYPNFPRARATTFTLHPGELLFVPSRWWHTARIRSPSITVSTNVLNESNWHNFTEDMQRNTGAGARVVKFVHLAAEHAPKARATCWADAGSARDGTPTRWCGGVIPLGSRCRMLHDAPVGAICPGRGCAAPGSRSSPGARRRRRPRSCPSPQPSIPSGPPTRVR